MKRGVVLTVLLGLGIGSLVMAARQAEPKVAAIEKVKDTLYVITGGGGNTAAFITAQGVVVVDTKLDGWGQPILDQIRTVTDKPVTTIINTHTHGDHVGSNDEFPATVHIVAHENTRTNMAKMPAFQGDNAKFLPHQVYTDKMSLLGGSDQVDLYYFGPGHTNGDTIIVFPVLRVAHTGDLFPGKATPFIDHNNGGSGLEYPKTLARALAGIAGVDTVIPGHSAVTDWQALRDFADFTGDFLAAVEASHKAGQSQEEAVASLQLPDRYREFGMNRASDNVARIYEELGR